MHLWSMSVSRLYAVFLIVILVCVGGLVSAQQAADAPIDFSATEEELSSVILRLSQESGVNIAYSSKSLPDIPSVSYSASGKSTIDILSDLLSGQGFAIERVGSGLVLIPVVDINNTYVISGYVKNVSTGESLVNAHIVDLASQRGSFTNDFGFFTLRLRRGDRDLSISYLGYAEELRTVELEEDEFITFQLTPSVELSEVVIYGREYWQVWEQSTNARNVPITGLRSMTSLGGSADPMRYTLSLAGVSSSADGVGGISVRGADQQHNLFLMDGVKVYNPTHLNGLISLFGDRYIKSARFYKTAGPARYQGALASVLDVRTHDGNRKSWNFHADADLLSGALTAEGPLQQDKSSLVMSARYGWVQPFVRQSARASEEVRDLEVGFHDLFLKTSFTVGPRSDLFFMFYSGGDTYSNDRSSVFLGESTRITAEDFTQLSWGNRLASARWAQRFSRQSFGRLTLSYSAYEQEFAESEITIDRDRVTGDLLGRSQLSTDGLSEIEDIGLQYDLEVDIEGAQRLAMGVQLVRHSFAPGLLTRTANGTDLDPIDIEVIRAENESYDFTELAAYLEDEWSWDDQLTVQLGINASLFPVGSKRHWQFNPRVNLDWRISEKISLYANASRASQYFHLLQTSSFGLPSDSWVPLTEDIAPQTSWTLGGSINFLLGDHQINLGGYYRQLRDLVTLREGSIAGIRGVVNIDRWESLIAVGEGEGRGLELEWLKSGRKLRWTLSYTFSESTRKFDEINRGRTFFDDQDRPHRLQAQVLYRLSGRLELSSALQWMTGTPYTFPVGEQVIVDPETGTIVRLPIIESRNGVRLPDYRRIDMGVNYRVSRDKVEHLLHLGVYNLTNAQNPLYIRYVAQQDRETRFTQLSLIPLTPSLRYSVSF